MANESILLQLVSQLAERAAKDIGFEHCEENVDQIKDDLINNYGIDLSTNAAVNTGTVSLICECILEWQQQTLHNHNY